LQCVAVEAAWHDVVEHSVAYVAVCYSVLQCIVVCCKIQQCVAVFCSVLQCVAACCSGGGVA